MTAAAAVQPHGWDGLVVLISGSVWGGPRLSEAHVAEHLARWCPVLYVDPPLSWRARRDPALGPALDEPPLRMAGPALARLTPRTLPGKRHPGLRQITDLLTRRALRRAWSTLGGPQVRAVISVPERPIFGLVGEDLRIHWAKDDYVAGARLLGHPAARRRRGDRRMAAHSDLVIAASPVLEDKWRELGCRTLLLPPGCDAALLACADDAPPADDVTLPAPIAGFVGTLSQRIDVGLLEAVSDAGHSLLLVGPRQRTATGARIDRLLARPNVQWVGPRPYERLPSYLRLIDTGVVPYASTPFNQASFPLKILEYLAAGRSVVSTDLPAVRWLGTDLVTVATSPEAFSAAVGAELRRPATPALVTRRRHFAARHTWEQRVATLVDRLELAVPAVAESGSREASTAATPRAGGPRGTR